MRCEVRRAGLQHPHVVAQGLRAPQRHEVEWRDRRMRGMAAQGGFECGVDRMQVVQQGRIRIAIHPALQERDHERTALGFGVQRAGFDLQALGEARSHAQLRGDCMASIIRSRPSRLSADVA